MKKTLFLISFFSFAFLLSSAKDNFLTSVKVNKFYVDSENGNDQNNGLSALKPWKTLQKVNNSTFNPGDNILLKRGSIWQEQLTPQSSGTQQQPIVIADYGKGDLPKIEANGNYKDGILLKNISYVTVKNIEISNFNKETAIQKNGPTGVRILAEDIGTIYNIKLIGLYIHDINGDNKKGSKEGHGIYWECAGQKKSNIENLTIEKCIVKKVDRNGIRGNGTFAFRDNWFPNKNLIIRNCLLEDIGGDGIVIKGFDGALVEHNKLFTMRARAKDNAVGIWPHSSDNTIIQFNEVAFTKNDDWSNDGQSFDIDGNCVNTIIRNNYSHDNDGGFMLVISDAINAKSTMTKNNQISNNLSINDGLKRKRLFNFALTTDSTLISNNIFINSHPTAFEMELIDVEHSLPKNIVFKKNEFYFIGQVTAKFSKTAQQYKTMIWDSNFFKGNFKNKEALTNNNEAVKSLFKNTKNYPWKFLKNTKL